MQKLCFFFFFTLQRKISTCLFKDQVSLHNISHSQQIYQLMCDFTTEFIRHYLIKKKSLQTFLVIKLLIFTFLFLYTFKMSFTILFSSSLFAEHIAHMLFLKWCWVDLDWIYFIIFSLEKHRDWFLPSSLESLCLVERKRKLFYFFLIN